ncbi:UDP-N-acetylmuramoylalanyl-D-glutamyl-2,6-diaminopimelate--D-alanyl-D-alanine ligase [Thalassospira sp.]|uniref:UDP-N-acetylmuramoylalanyl-D-glutamyl-2, 6-diaminopimelate--D-alanyl-D-alanine ligase n=1 Tax=Thalassospira sp. TaxID=1912094 RepID=UPI0027343AC9|nr:UDP-N-acetylmuramoylalanyl-D-glutamyl-2,6-diaminopimelate--D-alanyl-D-alanine ligase [Thalassospira sp.]MDP2698631.1 UDP-N-acetylmuramoylalanyl-D-glutamyl-2,6-diaminopimelate--D-alanyl-D-alanine ligase [Thalassospira sp.]
MTQAVLWTAKDAATATGGKATGNWQASGLSIDSRKTRKGDVFIALKGPNFDGHKFATSAIENGCVAAMVSDPAYLPADAPCLVVDDTLDALNRLGLAGRARSTAKIIAITGSVGKTGTKEALKYLLGEQAATHASPASFNNHWGVPMSLAILPVNTQYGVFEIGMNHPGEISPLVKMVKPSVAIITTVVGAHTEFFKNEGEIATAKAEIFDGLEPGGTAILNRDNPHFFALQRRAKELGIENIKSFGTDAVADYRLFEANITPDGSAVRARMNGRDIEYFVGCPGEHWVMNSLAVLAGVEALGGDILRAAQDFADFTPPAGRGAQHIVDLPGGDGSFTLIDDAYNANPTSMLAGLNVLAATKPQNEGRKIAVLGDMRELGNASEKLHGDLAHPVIALGIDAVYTVGPMMAALRDALPDNLHLGHFETAEDAIAPIRAGLRDGDVVLVKGSLGIYVSKIVQALNFTSTGNSPHKNDA